MIDFPRIAMSPGDLPSQRMYEVVDLPKKPDDFEPVVSFGHDPESIFPKRRPSNMQYLGSVEWAWGPRSDRIAAYHLHRARKHWILYAQDLDPNDPAFAWVPAAYVRHHGIEERQAATHLMIAVWRLEAAEFDLDQFHWINQSVYLSVAEWMAIARAVWRPEG